MFLLSSNQTVATITTYCQYYLGSVQLEHSQDKLPRVQGPTHKTRANTKNHKVKPIHSLLKKIDSKGFVLYFFPCW